MKQSEVISELKERIVNQIERVHNLQELHSDKLSISPSAEKWNVLQCLEHLNRYADFYIHSIGERLSKAGFKNIDYQNKEFNPGLLGKKFCDDMLPKEEGSLKKMKTFKSKNPAKQESTVQSLERFQEFQEGWLKVLDEAKQFNLNKNKCKLTIPLIKMNLGSTLRFVIYHQERHIQQAEKAVSSI